MSERTKKLRFLDFDVDGEEAYVEIKDPLYVSKKTDGFWPVVRKWQQSVREGDAVESDDAGDELVFWFIVDFNIPGVEALEDMPTVIVNSLFQNEVLTLLNPSNLKIEKG